MDKQRAMLRIRSIMDDGADEEHSENSENSEPDEKEAGANVAGGSAGKDDDMDRRRGGSVV
jgi:hypothetical protein